MLVTWSLGQGYEKVDADSWKIEQNGQIKCGNNDSSLADIGTEEKDTPCCLDTEQDYTLTCTSQDSTGFDYVSSSGSYVRGNGYILIDGNKYCDAFEKNEEHTIKSKTINFTRKICVTYKNDIVPVQLSYFSRQV